MGARGLSGVIPGSERTLSPDGLFEILHDWGGPADDFWGKTEHIWRVRHVASRRTLYHS